MTTMIIETTEGIKTIAFDIHTRVTIRLEDGSELTLHNAGVGLELRTPRMGRYLVIRPLSPGAIIVSVEEE